MAKKNTKGKERPTSGAISRLALSLQSAIHANQYCGTDNAKESQVSQQMIKTLLPYLEKAGVMNKKGNVLSERRISYLAGIIPYFSSVELEKMEHDPKKFVEKFCVKPDPIGNPKETTLALDQFYIPDPRKIFGTFDEAWIHEHRQTFQSFQEYTYNPETQSCCSPFELVPKDLLVEFYTAEIG